MQNGHNREFLYVGSNKHDEQRRFALCWVGGGAVKGDAYLGFGARQHSDESVLLFRIRNRKHKEYLYSGSSVLTLSVDLR